MLGCQGDLAGVNGLKQITTRNLTPIKLPDLQGLDSISLNMNNVLVSMRTAFDFDELCILSFYKSNYEVNKGPQATLFRVPIIRRAELDFSFSDPAIPSKRYLAWNSEEWKHRSFLVVATERDGDSAAQGAHSDMGSTLPASTQLPLWKTNQRVLFSLCFAGLSWR